MSQQVVSNAELGRRGVRPATLDRIGAALDARLIGALQWRGGELDRLLDERHAALVEAAIVSLRRLGWQTAAEVSYSDYGERGSIDVLGWHPATRALAVCEVKAEITSVDETHRRHDQKVRLAPKIAAARFGWRPAIIGRLLLLPEDSTARRRIAQHASTFASVLPARGRAVARWLRQPDRPIAGIWFLSPAASRSSGTALGTVPEPLLPSGTTGRGASRGQRGGVGVSVTPRRVQKVAGGSG